MTRVGNPVQKNELPQIWRRHDLPKQLNQNLSHELLFLVTVHRLQPSDSSAKVTVGCCPNLADLTSGQALSLSGHGNCKLRSQIRPQSSRPQWPAATTNTPRGPGNSGQRQTSARRALAERSQDRR
ncbi:hypothetical protein NL676_011532 [Syzygium grande]|nr:hypothetical protein NL676_011532 [Syzygium grande]